MSSDTDGLSLFERKLAEKRIAREKLTRAQQEYKQVEHDSDLIPDSDPRSDADSEMDRIIDGIDIIDAYNRWCGKMKPNTKGKTESIMISCPIPGHADTHPSAWINSEKQTWFCGACQQGGDAYDIAAFHHGYPVPGYKDGANFHELRRDMAKDLGYTFTTLPGGVVEVTPPEPEVKKPLTGIVTEPEPTATPEPEDPMAEVVDLYEDDEADMFFSPLPWKEIIPEDTYMSAYMTATTIDDVPEEFHFWNGLLGLGFAIGREVRLSDFMPVYGNLFVCTLGRSGSGKSKARNHLTRLLSEALPHDWSDPMSKGVRKISSPGSAEVLIHNFQKPVMDPTDAKRVAYYAPVRGLIDFNELSQLIGRASRMGNVTIPTLMQFYDMEDIVATSSMAHGSKEAHEPFGSALTTTQPRALRSLITKSDDASGFLNRWVFAPGRTKQRFAIGGVQVDMGPVVPKMKQIVGWAGSFGPNEMMVWGDEATERFTKFFHHRIEQDKKRSDTDLLIRLDLLMKKLILLFSANRLEKTVSLRSVEDAIACYDYMISAYAIPEAQIGNTIQNEVSEAMLAIINKNPNGVTLNQIARSLKRRKYPNELLLKTADNLVKLGFLKTVAPKAGAVGRPTTRYKSA
jgi:energy-coupling factor transporter ATP-binding protein EcfA2